MKTHEISKDSVSLIGVAEHEAGQRLDNYLIKILKGVPKSHIHRIIRAGEVRLNKKRCKPDSRIAEGDTVRIPPVRVAEKEMPSERRAAVPARVFEVVYEDDALLVIDKPSGVAVHGGSGVSFGVIEQLRRARPEAKYLELVHRLDKDTSGLLMVAKKRPPQKNLPCAGGGQTAGRQFPCQTAPVQIHRRTRRKDGTRQRGRAGCAYGVPCVKPFFRRYFARCRAVAPDFGAGNAENGSYAPNPRPPAISRLYD